MRRREAGHAQRLLLLITLALVAFGLVMVYSATSASAAIGNGNPTGYLERQAVYAALYEPEAMREVFELGAKWPPLP